ncbi:hypothetical protein WJX73_009509 [Symbiochloris irregularis]|uniref:4a-hydroxytetrahydrobiopterin dehydratase n=1 Tax=Symbiochloris irregularis TaxID=706552 RepID=A0AAW1NV91_9CHLO
MLAGSVGDFPCVQPHSSHCALRASALRCLALAPALCVRRAAIRNERRLYSRPNVRVHGLEHEGDIGARDPFEAELTSNFGDKVLGNSDTYHIIRGPPRLKELVGLATKRCVPCENGNATALSEPEANKLRGQTPGWRIIHDEGGNLVLQHEWKVNNFTAGLQLFARIGAIAEVEGHHPDLSLENWNQVSAKLMTHSVGGLTENDFILAAKINALELSDLLPKKKQRFWA